ncbi:MAG: hypothetical protein IKO36_00730 [Bacteroidaceae bacterium]|nr:hypothetical protein [Bacteroidaceae bacterium]
MKNIIYNIAYKDKNGKDFNGLPWLDGIYYNMDALNTRVNELTNDGYIDVTPFSCKDEFPETVSWDYVKSHKM